MIRGSNFKRWLLLGAVLSAVWLGWSGYFDQPFLLFLGAISVGTTVYLGLRMAIVDDEGAPIGFGFRPIAFAGWLAVEIVKANIEVTRVILDPELPIRPQLFCVKASQRTALGRVIMANSITLTPGTISVDMQRDQIWVHSLSLEGAEDDSTVGMDRRVCALEAPA